MVGWFLNVRVNYYVISRTGPKTERLTILRAATYETEPGDHGFCLSRSHYTDTDPTSRERAATAGIEHGTSSLVVVIIMIITKKKKYDDHKNINNNNVNNNDDDDEDNTCIAIK